MLWAAERLSEPPNPRICCAHTAFFSLLFYCHEKQIPEMAKLQAAFIVRKKATNDSIMLLRVSHKTPQVFRNFFFVDWVLCYKPFVFLFCCCVPCRFPLMFILDHPYRKGPGVGDGGGGAWPSGWGNRRPFFSLRNSNIQNIYINISVEYNAQQGYYYYGEKLHVLSSRNELHVVQNWNIFTHPSSHEC